MKLFNVSCEIMIDAQNAEDAMQKIRYFLSGDYDVDINFLVHSAEADESFEDIEALRNHQAVEHTLAVDDAVCSACGEPMKYHVGGAKRGLCKNRIATKA